MSFNNGATASAKGIAIDASGNAWSITGSSRLSKLSSQGAPLNGSPFSTNLNGPGALAIDTSGNVWVVNAGNGTLAGFANSGSSFAGPISGLNSPDAATFDRNGFLWIANYGNSSLTEFNPFTNSFISPSAGYTNGISSPAGIVADYLGNVWVANATSLTQLNPIGAPSSGSPYVGGGISTPYGIAIDGPGNVCGCLTIRRAARWRNSTAAGRRSLVAGIPAAAPAPRLRLPSMAAKMFGSR
jgi:streptogramin lyase